MTAANTRRQSLFDASGAEKRSGIGAVFEEELKTKNEIIEFLNKKISRSNKSYDALNKSFKELFTEAKSNRVEIEEKCKAFDEVAKKLNDCYEIISELSDRCEAQKVEIQKLKHDLSFCFDEPEKMKSKLNEVTSRKNYLEEHVAAENAKIQQWRRKNGLDAAEEPSAEEVINKCSELQLILKNKEKREKNLTDFIQDLQNILSAEQDGRQEAEKSMSTMQKQLMDSKAKMRNMSLQLEHARSDALNAASKTRQLQESIHEKETKEIARQEENKMKKHKLKTNQMASNKALEDRIMQLERQLSDVEGESNRKVNELKTAHKASLEKWKQKAQHFSSKCIELEKVQKEPVDMINSNGSPKNCIRNDIRDNNGLPMWLSYESDIKL